MDTSTGWPGLKAVLASPHCPIRTLVLPPPDAITMVRAFGLAEGTWADRVREYLESVFGSPDPGRPGRVSIETVRLDGWSLEALRALHDTAGLKGFAVKRFLITEPKSLVQLLSLPVLQAPLFLEKVERAPDELLLYSHRCWIELISQQLKLPPNLENWPEFSNRRLNLGMMAWSHCGREEWLYLADLLKDERCPLEALAFSQTAVSRKAGGRKEFLSAFASSGLKLDLSDWRAESERFPGGLKPEYIRFGQEDIDHLLTLKVPKKTVIVLSDRCIAELGPQLDQLVRRGWAIEDPTGRRLTSDASVAGTEEPIRDTSAGETGHGTASTGGQKEGDRIDMGGETPSPAESQDRKSVDPGRGGPAGSADATDPSDVAHPLFEARVATIESAIKEGRMSLLENFLPTWLAPMSDRQLNALLTMARRYGSGSGPVQQMAAKLEEAVTKKLAPPKGSTQVESTAGGSGAASDTFRLRKQSIEDLIATGVAQSLSRALSMSIWLDFKKMSTEQLDALQALADQYLANPSDRVVAAAEVLNAEVKKARGL